MIKIIKDFLPKPLFQYMKRIVENELFDWNYKNETIRGDGKHMLTKTLYCRPELSDSKTEVWDKDILPLFGCIEDFQKEKLEFTNSKLLKMKLNMYLNQKEPVEHGRHTDIPMQPASIFTSVFNFTNCDGYTFVFDDEGKAIKVPSIENSLVIFDGKKEHYGVTQTDTARRIVLNTNVYTGDAT